MRYLNFVDHDRIRFNGGRNSTGIENYLYESIIAKKHTRPSAQNRQGGIIESEVPFDWSNAMLLCNKCVKPVRIKMQRLEDGKKVRVCRKCNEQIDA